jgi:hypothetical protein
MKKCHPHVYSDGLAIGLYDSLLLRNYMLVSWLIVLSLCSKFVGTTCAMPGICSKPLVFNWVCLTRRALGYRVTMCRLLVRATLRPSSSCECSLVVILRVTPRCHPPSCELLYFRPPPVIEAASPPSYSSTSPSPATGLT